MSLGIKLSNFFRLKAEATDSLLSNPSAEGGSYRLPVLVPGFRLLVRGFRLLVRGFRLLVRGFRL
jgi:hypothetical protein